MNRNSNSPKQWVGIAAVVALLATPTHPAFSAESNETDLNRQKVTPPGSTRASSPAKDDVIYQPSTWRRTAGGAGPQVEPGRLRQDAEADRCAAPDA
jgi:hypothetical protein